MKTVLSWIKKHWFISLLALLVGVLAAASVVTPTLPPTPKQPVTSLNRIQIGIDDQQAIVEKLGTPIKQESRDSKIVADYQSEEKNWPHQVVFENGTARLVKQRQLNSPPGHLQRFIDRFGPPETTVKTADSGFGVDLFLWASLGLGIKAHKDGAIFELWYFEPTTVELFTVSFSADIGTPPPESGF